MSSELAGRLLKGGAWAAISRLIAILATMALYALLARLLSPAELGSYFLIMSIVGFLGTLIVFGMPQVAVRMIASSASPEQMDRVKDALTKIVVFVLVSGLVISMLLLTGKSRQIFGSMLQSPAIGSYAGIIGPLIVFTALLTLLAEFFRGFHDIRLASIIGGVALPVISFIFLAFLWIAGVTGLTNVMLATLFASVCVVVISVPLFHPYWKKISGHERLSYTELFGSAWPIAVFNLAVILSAQGVLWVISYSMSEPEVAVYGAVLRIVAMLTMTHMLLIATSQSSMAELFALKDTRRLQKLARGVSSITTLVGLIAMLVLIVAGIEILGIIFGDYYKAGYQLLLVITGFYVVNLYFGPAGMLLIMTGHIKSFLWVVIITTIFRFVMGYYFANIYGAIGVAIAWGVGTWMQGVLGWILVKMKVGVYCHAELSMDIYKEILSKYRMAVNSA